MKLKTFITALLFSTSIFAQDVDVDFNSLTATITGASTITLFAEGSAGGTKTSPAEFYLPLDNNDGANNHNSYYFSTTAVTLPNVDTCPGLTGNLNLDITVDNNSSDELDRYLYIASKRDSGDDDYTVLYRYPTTISDNTNSTIAFAIPLDNIICENDNLDEDDIKDPNNSVIEDKLFYIFLSDSLYSPPSNQTFSDNTGGIFANLNFSTQIQNSFSISILDTIKGDNQFSVQYSAPSLTNLTKVKAIISTATMGGPSTIADVISDTFIETDYPAVSANTIKIKNLINNQDYFGVITLVDKYGFATQVSPEFSETPLDIESLLQKEACFLFTAGFGSEHYIINYFKSFRDNFLKKFWFGRKFINLYYESAPKYALFIYKKPWLRKMMRGAAYSLYFFFNNFFALVMVSCLFILGLSLRRRYGRA